MPFTKEELISVVEGKSKEEILGKGGILKTFVKNLVEAALEAEMKQHLGYEKNADKPKNTKDNARNGHSAKNILGEFGKAQIAVPRDRNSEFEPQIIEKHQTRFEGFDDKIIAMYARGMSTRDIQAHIEEIYGAKISPTLISNVTDDVIDAVKEWQSRPLDDVYPIVYLDAIVVKVVENKKVIKKAVNIALGINKEGIKEVLGLWICNNEGAKFWLQVLTELKNRGVKDILIACIDGLTGFPEAIEAVYPETQIQLCIVHMVRNSLRYVPWKDKKKVAASLREIYASSTAEEARVRLQEFCTEWDHKYPSIGMIWERHWENVIPMFNYPADIRKVMYTTNAIESVNMSIRKVIKNKRLFPNDDAVLKILYLGLNNASKKWTKPIRNWSLAMSRFAIEFGDRFTF
jgi:putative transposase